MKLITLTFLILIFIKVPDVLAKPAQVPSWLDTIPPHLTIQPTERIQNKVFSVSLSSSEQGQVWYRTSSQDPFKIYKRPLSFTRDGIYPLYYYAEDDFGNKSPVDSITYLLDTKPPKIMYSPQPGAFKAPVYLHVSSDEQCSYFFVKDGKDSNGVKFADSILIQSPMQFRIAAIDKAGNKTISNDMKYIIDTTSLKVTIDPKGGIYNRIVRVSFKYNPNVTVWYTFDPLASTKWFTKYDSMFALPHGMSSLRYFARSQPGIESDISTARFIVDTIPPRLIKKISNGNNFDTLRFSCRERAIIRYTRDGMIPTPESDIYTTPLVIPKTGIQKVKARAWDEAGNVSEIIEWEFKYDFTPPEVEILTKGATYRSPFTVYVKTNEPAKILYTLDNTKPGQNSLLYDKNGIPITLQDSTVLRVFAIDSAGNISDEKMERYYLDSRPPFVKVRIDGSLQSGQFTVTLAPDEPSKIYYEIGGANPTMSSNVYNGALQMTTGQSLKYFAVDNAGNASAVGTMDELRKPMVEANPHGGVYNKKINITFSTNAPGSVYYRILPDTNFTIANGDVALDNEGQHTLEYFLETEGGLRGSVHRQEYLLDWTPPEVEVRTRKGTNDSAIVFLLSNERATFYYTTDGTNPLVSSTTGTAGNKFLQNSDRIVLKRKDNMKLSLYAQDAAGNQSRVSILDIFKPHAIPDIPAGKNRVHEKVLSISFNTIDEAVIYYTTDNTVPTQQSPIYSKPITLLASDTIMTLVVDASGFSGTVDTFIYLIDLPPIALFTLTPDTTFENDTLILNASSSFDKEYDASTLKYMWDFNGDGIFDTDTLSNPIISHTFKKAGFYRIKLAVYDSRRHCSTIENVCIVKERCPSDMVSVISEDGSRFCIDLYEWPNIKKAMPLTGVSWVEAKMSCIDAGKRLCTASEWEKACQGQSNLIYPYGDIYEKQRCPVETKNVQKSGSFTRCESTGAFDMLGNVWEWVEDKHGDYPLSYGGSFRYGKLSRCNLRSEGNVASQSSETGFRCCK